ncbi:FGGY-family carbohydrate kinase [Thiorhodovibrio frisius]|uniref:Pentulose/hexulose kinase n=1 Tax=Thiorhodovibrio frisius TaxID=631362 RepID=H8Z403_9GAMM|nr:FGGY-family carbohydrate kinase [Thiorhodovibrio frisius]EIC20072.1 pentulose/hexulose kinase [Thiorhodovibrio frisius]WPL20801.1 Xylulose kinase [Thiorhodovibrio frisius]
MIARASRRDAGVIGLDVGTSGCRAVAVACDGTQIAEAQAELPASVRANPGWAEQRPQDWWLGVRQVLSTLASQCGGLRLRALCLDATSATVLLCDAQGQPLGPALMYDDSRAREQAAEIERIAPMDSPARGASSSLAKLLWLRAHHQPVADVLALHQADWLSGCLTGRFGFSDWNNNLKMGFDPQAECWPGWIEQFGLAPLRLPEVVAPGTDLGPITAEAAAATGLPADLRILAGTTDSTAAVLATGALEPGDAVTSLGSTLVVKMIAEQAVTAPEYGIYSHRLGSGWLLGGASNSGGGVLAQFFSPQELKSLSARIDPTRDSGLGYYPLPGVGERFPTNDPNLAPRMQPRPASDVQFLRGLLEGIARIEQAGYERLQQLGAPAPRRVLTIGGGARNTAWTCLRERLLGVPVEPAEQQQAAYGVARLALRTHH